MGVAGFVNRLLSWKALVPLSRLTYMAYLVHPIVMYTYYYQQKYLINYDDFNIVSCVISRLNFIPNSFKASRLCLRQFSFSSILQL